MKLILLGTTGYHPNDRRQTACLMIPEAGILLDAGTGMYRAQRYLRTRELDVFVTHAHLDHVIGITYLFDIVRDRQLERVTVHARADKLEAIQKHLLNEALFPARLPCEFRPLAGEVALAGGGRLSYVPLAHPGGSVGYRLDWPGHSLAYITDTTATVDAPYLEFIRGVNVLVHECYFADGWDEQARLTGHSVLSPVAQLARAAGVGRLVLVHVDPFIEQDEPLNLAPARAVFKNVSLGHDFDEIEF